jgi:hypothetical protein
MFAKIREKFVESGGKATTYGELGDDLVILIDRPDENNLNLSIRVGYCSLRKILRADDMNGQILPFVDLWSRVCSIQKWTTL